MKKITYLLSSILVFVLYTYAPAQRRADDGHTPLGIQQGSPTGSFAISGFESVNPFTGGLNVNLPLLNVGGRGSVKSSVNLKIETKWRTMATTGTNVNYIPTTSDWMNINPGYGPGVLIARVTGLADALDPDSSCPSSLPSLTRVTFVGPDGSEIEFRDAASGGAASENSYLWNSSTQTCECTNPTSNNRGKKFVSYDGSNATFISDEDIFDFYPGLGYGGSGLKALSGYRDRVKCCGNKFRASLTPSVSRLHRQLRRQLHRA